MSASCEPWSDSGSARCDSPRDALLNYIAKELTETRNLLLSVQDSISPLFELDMVKSSVALGAQNLDLATQRVDDLSRVLTIIDERKSAQEYRDELQSEMRLESILRGAFVALDGAQSGSHSPQFESAKIDKSDEDESIWL